MTYRLPRILILFAGGTLIGASGAILAPDWVWIAAAAVALALAPLVRRARGVLLMVTVVVLGILRWPADPSFPEWLLLRAPGLREVTATVVSYPDLGLDRIQFVVQPDRLPGRLLVSLRGNGTDAQTIHYGDRLRLVGTTRLPEAFDGFDYPSYLQRQGIFATMYVEGDGSEWLGSRGGLLRFGDVLRQRLVGVLRQRLSPSEAAVAQSLLFGDRSALDDPLETAFSRTGMMHLLAVSGLHLGILLAGLWFVLRRLGVRPAVSYPLVASAALAFLWLVGPRVSLLRASLLFLFLALGSVLSDLGLVLRRSVRPINGLAAAGLVLLMARPASLLDVGFQLTFAATASLLWIGTLSGWKTMARRLKRVGSPWPFRVLQRGGELILVSLAAQAGAAPVIALHFGAFHPWASLSSLATVPLAAAGLWLGLLAIVASPIPWLGFALARLFGGTLTALSTVVRIWEAAPGVQLLVQANLGWWMAGAVGFLAMLAGYISRRGGSWTSKSTSMIAGSDSASRS
jgi:competence protein ComEC